MNLTEIIFGSGLKVYEIRDGKLWLSSDEFLQWPWPKELIDESE